MKAQRTALDDSALGTLADLLTAQARPAVPALRQALGGASVSIVDAADMRGETPYRIAGEYAIYLIDGSGHCPELTADPAAATGVVLARRV